MATIYLTDQQSVLRKEQNRLVIERDGVKLAAIHDFKVDRVVIFGNVQVTTQVIAYLLQRGIDTVFLSQHGKLKGRLAAIDSNNAVLRVRQYERSRDSRFALALARRIVAGKMVNCVETLARRQRNFPHELLCSEIEKLQAMIKTLPAADSQERLLGIEGSAAAIYFQGFKRLLRRGVVFESRKRRPPTDPVNAALSLGYTLLYNEAIAALAAAGFDPYIGFYHKISYGRCSLALDLIEEFRPITVDRLTLKLFNLSIISPAQFLKEETGAVRFDDDARKKFFVEYENVMTSQFTHHQTGEKLSLRRALHDQALALRRSVMRGMEYPIFRGWH